MKLLPSLGSLALLLAAVVSPAMAAEPAHPAKPLLWKVEGNGMKAPSYLFGTIHLSIPPVGNLHPAAQKAFEASDAVYTEVPLDTASQMTAVPLLSRKDGKTLDESIGDKVAKELNDELRQINPQLDSKPFQTLKTWAVAITVPMLQFQLKGEKALDVKLWDLATEEGKTTGALETTASQVKLFEDFSEAEQVHMLADVLKQLREDRMASRDSAAELIAAYASGDEKKVLEKMNEGLTRIAEGEHKELGERFIKRFLTDRDVSMAATIDEKLRAAPDKVNFFAVGAAHYVGHPGIRAHLTGKGYRITPITE